MYGNNKSFGPTHIQIVLMIFAPALAYAAIVFNLYHNDTDNESTEKKDETHACQVALVPNACNDATYDATSCIPFYASDYEDEAETFAACEEAVESAEKEQTPIEDAGNGDTVQISGDMMTWVTTYGVRICLIKSKVPWDVSNEGPQGYDIFRYGGELYVCPINATPLAH